MTASFTCPFCDAVSHNPNDAQQRYCGRCHLFVDDVLDASPAVRKAMARFCRRLAEVKPEQAKQLLATAEAWSHGLESAIDAPEVYPFSDWPLRTDH